MRCPRCGSMESKVLESRTLADGNSIRRRRECIDCSYRYTSYERIEEKQLMVIKRSSARREPLDRVIIVRGVQQAVRKRPVSQMQIANMIDEIEERATREGMETHEINSARLGEMVLERLYTLDKVAYVRFASVYRNFESVAEFLKEIEQLQQGDAAR